MNSRAGLRRLASSRARRSERGQTLVLVALAAVGLIAMVALGIDLIRLYDARSEAQNAADHAATTASHAVCRLNKTPTDARTDGFAVALENGFEQAGAETTTTVTHNGGTRFTAVATKTIDTSFAAVIGIHTLDASATAVGDCTGGGSGGAPGPIFAGGESCGGGSSLRNVEISGNDHIVTGVTHSNGSFYNGGSGSQFRYKVPPFDPTPPPNPPSVEYRVDFTGGSNTYTGPAYDTNAVTPWPTGWGPTDMGSLNWNAYDAIKRNASNTTDKFTINSNGVYYTDRAGGVDVDSVAAGVTSFVLVNKSGPVKIGIDLTGRTFTAFNDPSLPRENVIAMSGFTHTQNCDQFAIEKSGARGTFNGIMWATNAMVRWSGNEAILNGAVIAHSFQMNGNDHRINWDDSLFSGTPEVLLLE